MPLQSTAMLSALPISVLTLSVGLVAEHVVETPLAQAV